MHPTPPHLNLLKASEILSSSPVRMRIMMPILAVLSTLAMVLWWGGAKTQSLLLTSQLKVLEDDLTHKKSAHAAVLARMARVRELTAQRSQFDIYRKNLPPDYGPFLAHLAELTPPDIQFLSISVPEPPLPAVPKPKKTASAKSTSAKEKTPPPKNVERPIVRLMGRTTSAEPVKHLMSLMKSDSFTNVFVRSETSPRIRTFREENAHAGDAPRLLEFDIEFDCPERSFEK